MQRRKTETVDGGTRWKTKQQQQQQQQLRAGLKMRKKTCTMCAVRVYIYIDLCVWYITRNTTGERTDRIKAERRRRNFFLFFFSFSRRRRRGPHTFTSGGNNNNNHQRESRAGSVSLLGSRLLTTWYIIRLLLDLAQHIEDDEEKTKGKDKK